MSYPITISLSERLGTDLSSRSRAAALRSQIIGLVNNDRVPVSIDLRGIRSISESFGDELFGILVKQEGEEWFRKNLVLTNYSNEVRYSILSAINARCAGNSRTVTG